MAVWINTALEISKVSVVFRSCVLVARYQYGVTHYKYCILVRIHSIYSVLHHTGTYLATRTQDRNTTDTFEISKALFIHTAILVRRPGGGPIALKH
jgi:hypothetical protein